MPERRIKSACDLRTTTARLPMNASAQKLYLKIASLEMKRQRFEREQEMAKQKLVECADRCARITREVETLLGEIKTRFPSATLPQQVAGLPRVMPAKTPGSVRGSSVTHRY